MTGEAWYADTEVAKILDFDICYKKIENTNLPTLVLLHGFPSCSYDWYKMWPMLEPHFQLVAFDFLGFGRSDKPYPHDYSITEQTDITLELLNQLKVSSCYILAHDYAVSVTQEIITRIEENTCSLDLKKVIFLNGGLFSETHRARPIQKLLLGPFGKLINTLFGKKSFHKNLKQVFGPYTPPSQSEIDELWSLINYKKGKRVFYLLIRYILDRRKNRERWVAAMKKTSIPMRVVNGPVDPVSGKHMVERYKELIPNPNTVFLKGIGHYPNIEAPDQVSDQVNSYFR